MYLWQWSKITISTSESTWTSYTLIWEVQKRLFRLLMFEYSRFKESGSWIFCFDGLDIKSVLSVHAQLVLKFLTCFIKEKNKYKVFACFFENTYWLQRLFQKPYKIAIPAFLLSHWSCTFMACFQNSFQDHWRIPKQLLESPAACRKAGTSPLKRVTGRISQIQYTVVNNLIEASRDLYLRFSSHKTAQNWCSVAQ